MKFKKICYAFLTINIIFGTILSQGEASGLKVGDEAPQIISADIEGNEFNLKEKLKTGPVIIIFYRGGWCPYCNLQLRNLQAELVPELKKVKASMVAISVDLVKESVKTAKNENLEMFVISDPSATLIKSYKVINQLSLELVKKYKKNYSIDVEKSSGEKHHIIAIPSVFVVDPKDGRISFAYSNEDYKTRAKNKDILENLKKIKPIN